MSELLCRYGHIKVITSTGDCKECRRLRAAARSKTPAGILQTKKDKAKEHGRDWTISDDYFHGQMVLPCFVVGCCDKVTGLDRIDSSKGYIDDNVRPSCMYHNKMKSDMTDAATYLKALQWVRWYEALLASVVPS